MRQETDDVATRQDLDILTDVRDALDHRFSVPPEVQPHVHRGIVVLTGDVQWPFQRSEAEEAVRRVLGVHRVINEIAVAFQRPALAA
jgi:osmotically-inducible protein OsmY